MEREIEFRGQRADNKEWVYGSFINSVVKGSVFGYIAGNNVVEPVQVMRKTVGQYTGIADKNGKKVYVGDILQYGISIGEVVFGEYGEEPHTTMGFFLKINDALFTCEEDDFYYEGIESKHEIEVIGNIYENPELLNKIEYKGGSDNGD